MQKRLPADPIINGGFGENLALHNGVIVAGTPLDDDYQKGQFQVPDEKELLLELREMITHTNLSRGLFFSNHASNYLPVKARMPKGKQQALDLIDAALKGDVGLRPEWMRAL